MRIYADAILASIKPEMSSDPREPSGDAFLQFFHFFWCPLAIHTCMQPTVTSTLARVELR